MGAKSEQKRQLIIDKAQEVFAKKGYKRVTMKDIVEACEISRGGLYLYFESTADIFMAVLRKNSKKEGDVFDRSFSPETTAAEVLLLFLNEKKQEILRKEKGLTQATYEFYFENKPRKQEDVWKQELTETAELLEKLIQAGVEEGNLYCEDPKEAACNIMYLLSGVETLHHTLGLAEEAIDRQIRYVMRTLGVEVL